jgi:uncharacterized protein YfdQ (DUF2303 family)
MDNRYGTRSDASGAQSLDTQVIVDLTTVAQEIKTIGENPLVVLPNNYKVEDLEKYLPAPTRKRGRAIMHDATSFIAYFNLHKKEGVSQIYGVIDSPSFTGVLDDDSATAPGWRHHSVQYSCPQSPEWKEWKGKDGEKMNQMELAEFLESNVCDINSREGEPTGAELLEVANNFKAMKKVNFASGQVLANGQVDFKYQEEITGSAGATGHIKVPERFFIGIPVFEGGDPYRIEAKLRWRIGDGGRLTMWFELVRAHKVLEAAFDDIWHRIQAETGCTILRGKPA